jgi:hypothetical protein
MIFVFKRSVGTTECRPFQIALCRYQGVWSRSKCEETNYMIMSRAQVARHNGYTDRGNKNLASVEKFIYFGTTLANQNRMYKEIKGRLTLGNA